MEEKKVYGSYPAEGEEESSKLNMEKNDAPAFGSEDSSGSPGTEAKAPVNRADGDASWESAPGRTDTGGREEMSAGKGKESPAGNQAVSPEAYTGNQVASPDAYSGNQAVSPDAYSGNQAVSREAYTENAPFSPEAGGEQAESAGENRGGGRSEAGEGSGNRAAAIPGGAPSGNDSGKELQNTLQQVRSKPPKEKKKAGTDSYREKLLRHKKRVYRRTVILVILMTLALMGAVILWMRRGFRSAELSRLVALSAQDGTQYENVGGNVVQYGNEGAACFDRRGNTLWNVYYEMQQPVTSVSGSVIAIANRSGYYVYIMNTHGLLGTIHTMLPIHSVAASESGEVAVIMNDNGATWVRLYSPEGKEIAYIVRTMAENGFPITAAVSPDGETLCLSSIQMSNAAVKSNVSFYNFGKAGQEASDHLVDYSDFIDEVIPRLHYIDNSTCVGVSDKRLIYFRKTLFRSSGSTNILFSENLQGTFSSESFIGLLFTDMTEESQYRLDLYNKRGKKTGTVHFSLPYTDIVIGGDKIYIYNDQQCQIYTMSGRCLYDGTLGRSIRSMIPGASLSDLLVVTGGEIDSVRLH